MNLQVELSFDLRVNSIDDLVVVVFDDVSE